jgi:hypothetical protein
METVVINAHGAEEMHLGWAVPIMAQQTGQPFGRPQASVQHSHFSSRYYND